MGNGMRQRSNTGRRQARLENGAGAKEHLGFDELVHVELISVLTEHLALGRFELSPDLVVLVLVGALHPLG